MDCIGDIKCANSLFRIRAFQVKATVTSNHKGQNNEKVIERESSPKMKRL